MTRKEIIQAISLKTEVTLDHNCMTENGFERSDRFTIYRGVGNFQQVKIQNQYGQRFIINPNQIEKW